MYSVVLSTYKVFTKLDQEVKQLHWSLPILRNGGGQKLFAFPRKLLLM